MRSLKCCVAPQLAILVALAAGSVAQAQTVAYWRFETGPADTDVLHSTPNGEFDGTITDVSGNGNHLSAWSQGDFAGYGYRTSLTASVIPATGETNLFSVKNTGGAPGMFTHSIFSLPTGVDIELMTPRAFTIEASFKCENNNYRTIVGRDAIHVAGANPPLAALYFQIRPNNAFAFVFVDVAGIEHTAETVPDFIHGFDFPTDPNGELGPWYNAVGVSDGTTMSLYINNKIVAVADLSKSPDPSLARGFEDGSDWHAGGWSVGRGLFDGHHTDRGYGYIDEVRISNVALQPSEFLFAGGPVCLADFNNDSFVNSQDFFDFLAAFFGLLPSADFNNDTFINSQDFFDFLAAFFAGC
jgi:hypothetical protein